MTDGSQGESLLALAAASVDVDEAARRLLEGGTDEALAHERDARLDRREER